MLAEARRAAAEGFYRALFREARETDEKGRAILRGLLHSLFPRSPCGFRGNSL